MNHTMSSVLTEVELMRGLCMSNGDLSLLLDMNEHDLARVRLGTHKLTERQFSVLYSSYLDFVVG